MGEIVSMATLKHSSHLDTVAQWEKQGVQPRQNFLAVELFLSLLMHHYQDHDLRIRLKNDSTQRHTVTYRGKSEVQQYRALGPWKAALAVTCAKEEPSLQCSQQKKSLTC